MSSNLSQKAAAFAVGSVIAGGILLTSGCGSGGGTVQPPAITDSGGFSTGGASGTPTSVPTPFPSPSSSGLSRFEGDWTTPVPGGTRTLYVRFTRGASPDGLGVTGTWRTEKIIPDPNGVQVLSVPDETGTLDGKFNPTTSHINVLLRRSASKIAAIRSQSTRQAVDPSVAYQMDAFLNQLNLIGNIVASPPEGGSDSSGGVSFSGGSTGNTAATSIAGSWYSPLSADRNSAGVSFSNPGTGAIDPTGYSALYTEYTRPLTNDIEATLLFTLSGGSTATMTARGSDPVAGRLDLAGTFPGGLPTFHVATGVDLDLTGRPAVLIYSISESSPRQQIGYFYVNIPTTDPLYGLVTNAGLDLVRSNGYLRVGFSHLTLGPPPPTGGVVVPIQ